MQIDIFLFYHMLTWKVFYFLYQFEHNATVIGDENMKHFPQEFRRSKKNPEAFLQHNGKGNYDY